MDEPYIHGSYISEKRLADIVESGKALAIRYGDADRNQKSLTHELNEIRADCTHDLNRDKSDGLIWLGMNIGIEPHILEYMITDLISDMYSTGDEYVRKTLGELLVYIKMSQSERVSAFVEKQKVFQQNMTEANLQKAKPVVAKTKERYSTRINTINKDIERRVENLHTDKKWFISRVNRALSLAGRPENMCELDRKIVTYLKDKDFIGYDNGNLLINQDKIMFMEAVTFGQMIEEIIKL